MRNLLTSLILFSLWALLGTSAYGAGSSAAQFLQIQPGAKSAGMGGAYVALADGGDSLYWNPAGLQAIESSARSLSHMFYFGGLNYSFASYSERTGFDDVFSLGVVALYSDKMGRTTEDSLGYLVETEDDFYNLEMAFMYGWSRELNRKMVIGLAGKYIYQRIDTREASGAGLDAGMKYFFSDRLIAGMNIQHMGPRIKGHDLPVNIKAGGAYLIPEYSLRVALELNQLITGETNFALGAEHVLYETLALRAGYNSRADTGDLTGLHVGLGINRRSVTFDYAFIPYGELGSVHHISVGQSF